MKEELKEIKEIKEILNNISKRIEKIEIDIDKKNEIENNNYELYLDVNDYYYLIICFDYNGSQCDIGYINDIGECYFLYSNCHRENYEIWLDKGMKVRKNNEVEWRGKRYHINVNSKVLGVVWSSNSSNIYDFEFARPERKCDDTNIVRYSNGTPKFF